MCQNRCNRFLIRNFKTVRDIFINKVCYCFKLIQTLSFLTPILWELLMKPLCLLLAAFLGWERKYKNLGNFVEKEKSFLVMQIGIHSKSIPYICQWFSTFRATTPGLMTNRTFTIPVDKTLVSCCSRNIKSHSWLSRRQGLCVNLV